MVLRIDGPLGSFGHEGIKNFKLSKILLACDVVIRNLVWDSFKKAKIA